MKETTSLPWYQQLWQGIVWLLAFIGFLALVNGY